MKPNKVWSKCFSPFVSRIMKFTIIFRQFHLCVALDVDRMRLLSPMRGTASGGGVVMVDW